MVVIDFRKQLSNVSSYVPGMPLEEAKRRYNLQEVIKLASNECPFGPFESVLTKLPLWAEGCNRYPDTDCSDLTSNLSEHLGVSPEQIIIANGTTNLISVVSEALLEPGDEIVVPSPTFPYYQMAAVLAGAVARSVPMRPRYQYDLDAMLSAIGPCTKLVSICNPNNPTGTYVSERELRQFVDRVPKNVLVLIDEAYYEYADASDYATLLLDAPNADNLLVTRTFSKIYGLAGLRIGYGVANAEIINQFKKVPGPFSVNLIGQAAANESLKHQELVQDRKEKNIEWKALLCRGLRELQREFVDSQANFVMTKLGDDSGRTAEEFLRRGVIIRPAMANGWMRVSVGTADENQRFLRVLEEILEAKLV